MKYIFILSFILTLYTVSGLRNPGMKVRVTEKGLNFATNVISQTLFNGTRPLTLPDVNGSNGALTYSLYGMQVISFTIPVGRLKKAPKGGLELDASGAAITVNGSFRYVLREIVPITNAGAFDINISNATISLRISVEIDSTGHPVFKAGDCSCRIGFINIIFHGGAAIILNTLERILQNELKRSLEKQLCNLLIPSTDEQNKYLLEKFSGKVPIDTDHLIDYSFLSAPSLQGNFIEIYHKGDIYVKDDSTEIPFEAPQLTFTNDTTKMLYILLSDHVFNTFIYKAHRQGQLKYIITKEDLPGHFKNLFDTSCRTECIGSMIPNVGRRFSNSTVELQMKTTNVPILTGRDTNIIVNSVFEVDLYINLPNNEKERILTMTLNAKALMELWISMGNIYAKVVDLPIQIDATKSNFGPVNDRELNTVKKVLELFLKSKYNDVGAKGFPLPTIDRVYFENTDLKIEKNILMISTDVIYI